MNEFDPDYNIKENTLAMLKDLHELLRKMMLNIDRGDATEVRTMMAEIDTIKDELNVICQLHPRFPFNSIDVEKLTTRPRWTMARPLSDNLRMLIHYLEKRSYTKALEHLDEYDY